MSTGEAPARRRRGGVGWGDRATARDVAALAKVSAQTVSRVANGSDNVRPETREKVLAAMAKIGYSPNAAARALRSGKSDTIGVVVHHLVRTGEAHIVEAVATTARDHGYAVSLMDARSGSARDLNDAIMRLRQGVAGLVVLGLETVDVDQVRMPARTPVVVADTRVLAHPAVGFDQRGGAHMAVTHLLSLGHRTVYLLGGPTDSMQAAQREEAWRSTLTAAGREVPEPWHGDWSPASGYEIGKVIAQKSEVTAVFAANDEMAAGLLRALHEAGRRVPEDVSVVGFDDLIAEYLWPPLTTVHQDFTTVGENLLRLLIRQIDGTTAGGSGEVATLVPATLVVRASTGPAPA
ncbi:MAG: LacI family DNA-binding transcriptional regulator [Dermatophilus congolensis]|nr:LacI family DNA-binding transcriptional regulator [Dermatophilus congolensis]